MRWRAFIKAIAGSGDAIADYRENIIQQYAKLAGRRH